LALGVFFEWRSFSLFTCLYEARDTAFLASGCPLYPSLSSSLYIFLCEGRGRSVKSLT
jgi:hypothetical protein